MSDTFYGSEGVLLYFIGLDGGVLEKIILVNGEGCIERYLCSSCVDDDINILLTLCLSVLGLFDGLHNDACSAPSPSYDPCPLSPSLASSSHEILQQGTRHTRGHGNGTGVERYVSDDTCDL